MEQKASKKPTIGKNEPKQIILCQGDKKELEEITGEEYDYISNDGTLQKLGEKNFQTFYELRWKVNTSRENELKEKIFDWALIRRVDAFIHYTTQLYVDGSSTRGYVIGTPLRRKKGQKKD